MAKPIGTLGVIDTLTVGGRVFTDLTNLKPLWARLSTATNGKSTPRTLNASSGYVVPGGKTFNLYALQASIGGAADSLSIGYNDIDIGMSGNTAPVNPVYLGGNGGTFSTLFTPVSSQKDVWEIDLGGFSIPTGKYLFLENGASSDLGIFLYGYEV